MVVSIRGGRLMADWQKIKTEYITKGTSYRKLAEKYGIHYKTIAERGKAEGWIELRSQHTHNILTKTLECDTEQKVSRAEKLNEAADLLLERVVALVGNGDPRDMDTQGMRHISGVLKDLKEIYMVRSDADMREQEARIDKLRREAQKEEQNHEVTIVIEGGDASWQS
jgi:transposase